MHLGQTGTPPATFGKRGPSMSIEPEFVFRKPSNKGGLRKHPPSSSTSHAPKIRGLKKSAEPKIVLRVSENWILWGLIFLVLEVRSLRGGTPTLSATIRTFPKSFVIFWVWFAGHVLLGWKIPGEELLCRLLKASVRAAADQSGEG